MKIAYLVTIYKNPDQVLRLINRLNNDDSFFLIHADRKMDEKAYDKVLEGLDSFQNIYFTRKRYRVYWGDYNSLQATFLLVKELVEKKLEYDYAFHISGQHYPIKTNMYIQEFLEENRGKSFVHAYSMFRNEWAKSLLNRIEKWHWKLFNKSYSFPSESFPSARVKGKLKRKFPKDFDPFIGSSWWCLSKEVINYLANFIEENPEFVEFFKHVLFPGEECSQTILYNSPYKGSLVNDDLVYIEWPSPPEDLSRPLTLRAKDFDKLRVSPDLFARKFDATEDSDILDMIDKKLLFY